MQPQYPKTVEGQRHQPGPQGGHAVTVGTAEGALLWPEQPWLPTAPPRRTWLDCIPYAPVAERIWTPQITGCVTGSKSLTLPGPRFPPRLKVVIKEDKPRARHTASVRILRGAYSLPQPVLPPSP